LKDKFDIYVYGFAYMNKIGNQSTVIDHFPTDQ